MDLVFILDDSGSIGFSNWNVMLNFVNLVIDSLNISANGVRVGLVKFDSAGIVEFYLSAFTDKVSLERRVNQSRYGGGGTNIADGLSLGNLVLFDAVWGARSDVPKVAILVTDGQDSSNSASVANSMKFRSVTIIAIGIGSGVDVPKLKTIASGPNFVLNVTNFNALIASLPYTLANIPGCFGTSNPPSSATPGNLLLFLSSFVVAKQWISLKICSADVAYSFLTNFVS